MVCLFVLVFFWYPGVWLGGLLERGTRSSFKIGDILTLTESHPGSVPLLSPFLPLQCAMSPPPPLPALLHPFPFHMLLHSVIAKLLSKTLWTKMSIRFEQAVFIFRLLPVGT